MKSSDMNDFTVSGKVKMFPGPSGWIYVDVPKKYTDLLDDLGKRGLIQIDAKTGKTHWQTAVLPMGDGSQFIPLKKAVRKAESIEVGDEVKLTFSLKMWLRGGSMILMTKKKPPTYTPSRRWVFVMLLN